jgi:hypothetical protein
MAPLIKWYRARPKITEAIRRQGSIGYGRTADLLKLGEKEQLLLGEKFVKD